MLITFECSTSQKKPYKDYVVLGIHKDGYSWFRECITQFTGKGSKSSIHASVGDKVALARSKDPCNDLFLIGLEKKEAQHIDACVSAYVKQHPKSAWAKQAKDALDNWGIW